MGATITISQEEYQCLREHLNIAQQMLDRISGASVKQKASGKPPRETKAQKMQRIDDLITGKTRAKKPDYLKKRT